MCLITEQSKSIKTRKELTVYKDVLNLHNGIFSKYMQHEWELGILCKSKIELLDEPDWPYDDIAEKIYPSNRSKENFDFGKWIFIGRGFHSALNKERYGRKSSIAECIIPKGSLVYKDKTGLIVSNQIKMIKIINR